MKSPFYEYKLNTTEARALRYCQELKAYNGGSIRIEWRKSRIYGHNPVILHQGKNTVNISGCGYDKQSAALAELLCYMADDKERYLDIQSKAGCGQESVIRELARIGWKLEQTYNGTIEEEFRLSRL
jgi:hypothetical protein